MPWHFAEQLACVRWARPERTFCTCAHRVAASHCRRPALVLALPHSQPTRPDSSLAAEPLLELHSAAVRSAVAASGRPQQAPAMDGAARATAARQLALNSSSSSPHPARPRQPSPRAPWLQNGGSPSSLSPAAAEPTYSRYK